MSKKCPTHGGSYPCKQCTRARRTRAPQKPAATVQPTDAQVRAARANLLPPKRAADVDVRKHEQMAAADRQAEFARRSKKIYANLDLPGTRKQFGVTRYEIAKLLANPALHYGLHLHEVRWLVDLGFRHITTEALAHKLNTDLNGLNLTLDPLEAKVIANARARGIAVGHALHPSDAEWENKIDHEAAREETELDNDTLAKIVEGPGGNEGDNE